MMVEATSTMNRAKTYRALYDDECFVWFKKALEAVTTDASSSSSATSPRNKSRYADDDDSSLDEEEKSSSSSSSEEEKEEREETTKTPPLETATTLSDPSEPSTAPEPTTTAQTKPVIMKKKRTKTEMTQRQKELAVEKHFNQLPCESIPFPNSDSASSDQHEILVPRCLIAKSTEDTDNLETSSGMQMMMMIQSVISLARKLQTNPVVVISVRSGRFASAIFQQSRCLVHRTSQRYTVRKGQGKAQSSQDTSGNAPKSMGAQLRRHGELQLQKDMADTWEEWKEHLEQAALILLSCPKTMRRHVLVGPLLSTNLNICKVPLDMGRPTFESVSMIHAILTRVCLRERTPSDTPENEPLAESQQSTHDRQSVSQSNQPAQQEEEIKPTLPIRDLSPWHIAAQEGNLEALESLSEAYEGPPPSSMLHELAGSDWMTPLHMAAQCEATTASACVSFLLEQARANPCVLDSRHRVPYFLASHDKVREAFRLARGMLGEDYCAWDADAKVGPPLSEGDLVARKEKEAEKRRRKKARQKGKKAQEKAAAEESERLRREEEEKKAQEEEAKRVRAGLAPKVGGGNVCDFCQNKCRKKSQMFKRLEYSYCSTDCVNKHKRELMAAAALARFG